MFTFLLIVEALVATALISVILMQRSEGGGFAGGSGPSGLMTARGAADLLTRMTSILATAFIVLAIVLAALAAHLATPRHFDTTLQRHAPAAALPAVPSAPLPAVTNSAAPPLAPATGNSAVPLAQ